MTPELLQDIIALCGRALVYRPGRDPLPGTWDRDWPFLFDCLAGLRARAAADGDHAVALVIDVVVLRSRLQGGCLPAVLHHVACVLLSALSEDAFASPPVGPGPYRVALRRMLRGSGGAP